MSGVERMKHERPVVLISACLMGVNCRYDGGGKTLPELDELMRLAQLVPVCPEIMGGLSTPRTPAERVGDRVKMRDGTDVTGAFRRGAQEACHLARLYGARLALLKERSPSCGSGMVYDGSFSGKTVPGWGVAGEKLRECGLEVCGESCVGKLIERLKQTDTEEDTAKDTEQKTERE